MKQPIADINRLLKELECYLQDDIDELTGEGYVDRPGSALDRLYGLLDACIYWQEQTNGKKKETD